MKLTDHHIKIIKQSLHSENITSASLYDEAFDHLCSVSEDQYDERSDFSSFIQSEMKHFAPQGFSLLELQINFVSQSKSLIMMKKFMYILGLLATITLVSGILFKLMHWPKANMLLLVGQMVLFLVCIPFFAISKLRSKTHGSPLEKWMIVLGLIASLLISTSIIFKINHLMGANMVFVTGMILLIFGFIPLLFISLYRKNTREPKQADLN